MDADFGPLFAANAAAALVRRVGTHGVLDLHCTKGLKAIQYIGSVVLLDRGPRGLFAQGGGSGFVHSSDAIEINAVEQGQAIGVCLEVTAPLSQPQAYVQVADPCFSSCHMKSGPSQSSFVLFSCGARGCDKSIVAFPSLATLNPCLLQSSKILVDSCYSVR